MGQVTSKPLAIPLLDLGRQYAHIREEVLGAIERVCSTQQFVLGSEVEALEGEIAAYTATKAAVACASGTDALWLALLAAGVKPGDRILTTPFSFFASSSSLIRSGAVPVFVDISPQTLNLDPKEVAKKIDAEVNASTGKSSLGKAVSSSRNKANRRFTGILVVHIYGQCAEMDALRGIAEEHELWMLEDAAQAMGARWREQKAGSMGICGTFSFYPSKNLSAYGDAGMAVTQDASRAEHMQQLRNHGSPERYLHTELGWNARMDGIQAAVLRVKLKYLEMWNQQRRARAAIYDRLLEAAGLVSKAAGPVKPLTRSPEAYHVFHQYVIRSERRDELRKFLGERGIGTEVYYPIPLHLQPAFAYLGYQEGDLPESERAAKEVLALPMFPELTEEEQRVVVEAIADFYA